ncbi:MAG: hypothetical protein KDD10_18185 [Phaeodactylibacter sp.]|nr:hypothetical protein [Phaeodactylibacter sp.]MCB9295326.1 hypothetical protein [Lewinellaceae bacterium]
MGWVKEARKQLEANGVARVRPQGGSMRGRIESGQLVTIRRAGGEEVELGDAVFVRWKNNYILHLVKGIEEDRILIGNNLGKANGWIGYGDVIGKVVAVED